MATLSVPDTARLVAGIRAVETERGAAARCHDPFAARLAGESGRALAAGAKEAGFANDLVVGRTAVIDAWIQGQLSTGADVVVNLAAGLDARPWRMDLPPQIRWFDVDVPENVHYKATVLRGEPPRCRYEAIAADLGDPTQREPLLARIAASATRAVVITEGLLNYLTPEQVTGLARSLAAHRAFGAWILDIGSAKSIAMMNSIWEAQVADGSPGPYRFGPADITTYFATVGWAPAFVLSGAEAVRRLDAGERVDGTANPSHPERRNVYDFILLRPIPPPRASL